MTVVPGSHLGRGEIGQSKNKKQANEETRLPRRKKLQRRSPHIQVHHRVGQASHPDVFDAGKIPGEVTPKVMFAEGHSQDKKIVEDHSLIFS
jgi:hypothetical protein